MRIVGVDPGQKGALAFICGGVVRDVVDVPVTPDNSQVQIDGKRLCEWIEGVFPIDLAVIENVQPRQGDPGAKGESMAAGRSFRFGLICGELRMAFKVYGVPIRMVTPGQWKRHFGLLKQGKEESRQKALLLAKTGFQWLSRKGDHNRAESILIGLYGLDENGFL